MDKNANETDDRKRIYTKDGGRLSFCQVMVEKGRKKGNRLGDANKMNKIKWELEIRLFKRSEDDNDDNLRKDRKKKNIRKKDKNE